METRLTILVIELGVAILIQISLLVAILVAVRRSSGRVESLVSQVEQRALPAIDSARAMIDTSRPLLQEVLTNAASSSALLRQQIERVDVTLNDLLDRTRLQVIRADELASRAIDRVEEATEAVSHGVSVPVRQVAGVFQGIAAGVGAFFGRRHRERSMQHDEMFI